MNDYIGEDCSIKECINNCSLNGECDHSLGKCNCFDGFSDKDCSKKICINNCNNNGKCKDGLCFCNKGFVGKACEFSKF